jgi:hypothetical protein
MHFTFRDIGKINECAALHRAGLVGVAPLPLPTHHRTVIGHRTARACRSCRLAQGAARDVQMPLSRPMGLSHSNGHGDRKQSNSESLQHVCFLPSCSPDTGTPPTLGDHAEQPGEGTDAASSERAGRSRLVSRMATSATLAIA